MNQQNIRDDGSSSNSLLLDGSLAGNSPASSSPASNTQPNNSQPNNYSQHSNSQLTSSLASNSLTGNCPANSRPNGDIPSDNSPINESSSPNRPMEPAAPSGNKPKIIGIGDNGRDSLLPLYLDWINQSEVLVGGERQLQFFPAYKGEKVVLKGGLPQLAARLQAEAEQGRRTVVLASGDPLFYGIGGYLSSRLEIEVYPNLSSVQLAFARMGESWQDAELTSVHGRSMKGLAQRIDGKRKVALLTDAANHPAAIAAYLLAFGMTEYEVFVAENLDGPGERYGWYGLQELAAMEAGAFSPLNLVVLKHKADAASIIPDWPLGIDDELFAQRKPDKGLITKKEIRVLSLAQLGLRPNSIVWDIGTCTGSVAIEAARIARQGEVYAIEKNEGDLQNCLENMRCFRTDITAVQGRAPEGLEAFPDPNAIFIGGTGGEMKELLHVCCTRLKRGGRIVLNAATIENLYEANRLFKEEGFATSITLAQISRSKPILDMTRFEGLNPIYIITAQHAKLESESGGATEVKEAIARE